jgi:hypothetical protein
VKPSAFICFTIVLGRYFTLSVSFRNTLLMATPVSDPAGTNSTTLSAAVLAFEVFRTNATRYENRGSSYWAGVRPFSYCTMWV